VRVASLRVELDGVENEGEAVARSIIEMRTVGFAPKMPTNNNHSLPVLPTPAFPSASHSSSQCQVCGGPRLNPFQCQRHTHCRACSSHTPPSSDCGDMLALG